MNARTRSERGQLALIDDSPRAANLTPRARSHHRAFGHIPSIAPSLLRRLSSLLRPHRSIPRLLTAVRLLSFPRGPLGVFCRFRFSLEWVPKGPDFLLYNIGPFRKNHSP